jgi:hypothetical protein
MELDMRLLNWAFSALFVLFLLPVPATAENVFDYGKFYVIVMEEKQGLYRSMNCTIPVI